MSTLYPEAKKVTIAGKEFEVKKLPFRKLMKVTSYLKRMRFDKEGKILFEFPEDFENNSNYLIEALTIILDTDKKWLEDNLQSEEIEPLLTVINEVIVSPFVKAQGEKQKA